MLYNFKNLDEVTREFMVSEVKWAIDNDELYYSKRFVDGSGGKWQSLLLDAARSYDDHWLAFQIEDNLMLKNFEPARKPKGGYTIKHVPDTASETLACGQFNRYYILGLCQRAINEGLSVVEIYRAKESENPRQQSELLIGQRMAAQDLISELRSVEGSLKSELLKPNSGLSVKI